MAQTQKFLVNLDLRGNEIRNVVLGTTAGTAAGAIWFDSNTNLVAFVGENGAVQTVAPKSFVEAQVADLEATITTNVAQLSADIAAEASARSAAVAAVAADLATEVTARQAADAGLATDIATEASARAAADSALSSDIASEASARQSADAALQTAINAVAADVAALDSTYATDAALASEATARAAADSALDSRLTAAESKNTAQDASIAGLTSDLASESSTRASADSALDTRVTAVEGVLNNLDANFATEAELAAAVAAEASRAQAAEAGLATDVAANASSIAGVAADLATETARAIAAEGSIESNLTSEVARLDGSIAGVQSSLNQETADREAADSALDGRVSSLEVFSATVVTGVQLTAAMQAEEARADAYADAAALAAENNAKAHADMLAQGLNVKEAVRVVVTGSQNTPKSGTYTVGDVALQVGDRVIWTDGDGALSGGIYIVQNGAWTEATDWANDDHKAGSFVYVAEGWFASTAWAAFDANIGQGAPIWSFTQLTGAGTMYGMDGVTVDGITITINAAEMVSVHAMARKATATIGDGSATTYTVTHTLGEDVTVSVRDIATGELVMAGVTCSSSSVTIDFASAPAADAYRVVIIG